MKPAKGPKKRPLDSNSQASAIEPGRECPLCPRLVSFRESNRGLYPDWFNAPVPSFGTRDGRLLIVGLAPGLKGANRTARPFTGDFAGDLLYATLLAFGFASGTYAASADDGLALSDCLITNAVRCVPPENKPTPAEIKTCQPFLRDTIAATSKLAVVVALGRIAHDSVVQALGRKRSEAPFGHGHEHVFESQGTNPALTLFDSYHCSRYNTNTGVLTEEMFRAVFTRVRRKLDEIA